MPAWHHSTPVIRNPQQLERQQEARARLLFKPTEKEGSKKHASGPTPRTQVNRCTGRDGIGKKSTRAGSVQALDVPSARKWCGVIVEDRERSWCDDCYTEHWADKDRENMVIATAAELKIAAERADQSYGGAAARKRGEAHREHVRLN